MYNVDTIDNLEIVNKDDFESCTHDNRVVDWTGHTWYGVYHY